MRMYKISRSRQERPIKTHRYRWRSLNPDVPKISSMADSVMGKGSIHFDLASNRYMIDLAVTARYDTIALGHKLRWRRSFEFASWILFGATNGTMQLGKLYFVNDGTPTSDDDIVLVNLSGDSFTTAIGPNPLCGQITLTLHVMNEPACTIHEIGHYVGTLGDEYLGTARVCQNNPATHQCIMEFSRDFGLRLDKKGKVAKVQPHHVVNQFCCSGHPHVPLPLPTDNAQEFKHRHSCWETLKEIYPMLVLPTGVPIVNKIHPIQWIELTPISKYAIAIPAHPTFAPPPVEKAIKIAAKEWVNRLAATGDQLALVMGSQGVIRQMHAILPAEVTQLHKLIDASAWGEGKAQRMVIQNALDQFHGDMAAYQRLFLVQAGNSPDAASTLPTNLAEKRVTLKATTVGLGAFVDQLDAWGQSSKWVTQQNFPISNADLSKYAFSLQNELIESYFYNSPGYGIVDLRWGSLPATQNAAFAATQGKGSVNHSEGGLELFLQLGAERIDFPVWVEQDARSVSFLLSEPETSHIELSLIAPDGTEISVPARTDLPIHAFDRTQNVSGQWIVRLRRTKVGPQLPYFLIAAVNNRELRTATHIEISPPRKVHFRLQAIHTFPIDYIDAVVDILRLAPDEDNVGEIYRSLPLRRGQALNPSTQMMTEVSSGLYRGEIELEPGSYVAIFRAHNHGQAIYASNPDGVIGGNVVSYKQMPIPPFARVLRQRFQVK